VTSHFRNGWVFIVIKPAPLNKNEILTEEHQINPEKIEPLILDNVIIKAKNLVGRKALKVDEEVTGG
jgi:hypothetical protein